MPSILLFGVTGLVGSHLIFDLKKAYPSFPVTVYLRNTSIDTYLSETAGVHKIVHGTYDEHDKISALSKEYDIVINVGSSWDNGLSEAIVKGLSERFEVEGKKATLIHMSGTGNFVEKRWIDGAHHEEAKIWSDDNPQDMKLINPTMLNGGPDTIVLNAGKTSSINTYLIFPPIIHGQSLGPHPSLGVVQYLMQEKAKELGYIPYIGPGTTLTNALHVKDVSRFVLLVLSTSLASPASEDQAPPDSVYERTFIIGTEPLIWKNVADGFAKVLFEKGLVKSPEAKRVESVKEAGEGEIPMLMASDMRLSTRRAEKLGFEVKEAGLLEFLKEGKDIF